MQRGEVFRLRAPRGPKGQEVPVSDPSERQALADSLAQLETDLGSPSEAELKAVRELLLVDAGEWVHQGPAFKPGNAG